MQRLLQVKNGLHVQRQTLTTRLAQTNSSNDPLQSSLLEELQILNHQLSAINQQMIALKGA